MLKTLDIWCWKFKTHGAIWIDSIAMEGVDIVHNLEIFPWPIEDNTFDEVYCSHFLEHVNSVIPIMEELYRIMKHDGLLYIRVPHASCFRSTWSDPTHKRWFTVRSFMDYFNLKAPFWYYSKCDFLLIEQKMNYCLYDGKRLTKIPRFWQVFWNKMANLNTTVQELFERFLMGYVGGFEELEVKLRANKH